MRDRIWAELTQAKFNAEYLSLYQERQKKLLNIAYIIILAFSTSGIMGWAIWKNFPLMSCIIVSAVSFVRLVLPQFVMNEKTLSKLDKVHIFYCNFFNQLEKLWYQAEEKEIDDKCIRENFFLIINEEIEINKILNELTIRKPKKLVNQAKIYSDEYFKKVYNLNW